MSDPTPFLSTITGASASLVAIIGGLLVNRFIGIDSEQHGAQAVLDQAEERLHIARARAEEAQQAWETFEVTQFLNAREVLDALRDGARETAELDPKLLQTIPLSPDRLHPHLEAAAEEFARAREQLERMLKPASAFGPEDWRNGTWDIVRTPGKDELPATRWPSIWDAAFDAVVESRARQRESQDAEDQVRSPRSGAFPDSLLGDRLQFPSAFPISRLNSNQAGQRIEQQRTRLTTEKERAAQHQEDAEVEAARLRQRLDAIVRPDRQLWIGIVVLLYPTIVGIVAPSITMVSGPTEFTAWIRWLGVLFVTEVIELLVYMVYLATRLSLGRRRLTSRPAERDA